MAVTLRAPVEESSSELVADFDLTDRAPGKWTARVTNLDEGTGACTECFTVAASEPTVDGVEPASRGQGATGETLSVRGTNFAEGAQVTFDGDGIMTANQTFVSSTEVRVDVTIGSDASATARDVRVHNTDGQAGTCTGCFTVNAAPAPSSLDPSVAAQGASGYAVSVLGEGFQEGAEVVFSGAGISVDSTTFVDATQLDVELTIASDAPTGPRDVGVMNPDGGDVGLCEDCFMVLPPPTLDALDPDAIAEGVTIDVTLQGTNFQEGATSIFSGGIVVNSTTFVSPTELTANITIPGNEGSGFHDARVDNPDRDRVAFDLRHQ